MVQRLWLVVVVMLGACFSPEFRDGAITCGPNGSCPPGLECVGGVCRSGDVPTDSTVNFSLTVTNAGNGSGTVTSTPTGIDCGADCTEDYASGTMVTLTAAAGTDSTFVGWSGACTGTGTCTVTLNANQTVTANFALEYSLVVALAGNGSGFVSSNPSGINCGTDCSEAYEPSTMVALTGFAVTGSNFDGWSGPGATNCTSNGPCIVTLDQAKMVTATFSLQKHALTVLSSGNGSGTVSSSPTGIDCGSECSEAYDYNSTVTLTAVPATGSTFAGWTGGGCTGTGTCVVTITQATQVIAEWTLTTHTLTVEKAGNGATNSTVTSSPGSISCGATCTDDFDYNTTVTLSATPATGANFTGWTGGGCTGTGSCVVTMTQAVMVTATFTLTTPTLTAAKTGNGSGTVASTSAAGIDCGTDCSEPYNYGTVVTLTATPATGSTFDGWSGACTNTTGPCMVTADAAKTATATFTLTQNVLTVSKGASTGSGTVTGAGIDCGADCTENVNYNAQVTLIASPALGSVFTGWSGGTCTGTGNCTVTMTQATTVTATFTITTHQLSVSKGASTGTGTVTSNVGGISCGTTCAAVLNYGTSVTLTAAASTGSTFTSWGGACAGTPNNQNCTVTVNDATNVTATFTINSYALTVTATGSGNGNVTANTGAINCAVPSSGDCSDPYTHGTVVTLSANPGAGSTFTGWAGACTGNGTCEVTMNDVKSVSATFGLGSNALTVTKIGTGAGTVASTTPAGLIDCGPTCTAATLTNPTNVTLVATASPGSTFAGWSGACSGTVGTTCMLQFQGTALTATASFTLTTHTLTVTHDGNGAGTTTSSPSGINCIGDCNHTYDYGTDVTLTATPSTGSYFAGWSGGGCTGTGTCTVDVMAATTVTATYTLETYRVAVTKTGDGKGTVVANVGDLDCGDDCDETYNYNTSVTLTATPMTGAVFIGWSGACSGMGDCVLAMTDDRDVYAEFDVTQVVLTASIAGPSGAGTVDSLVPEKIINCPGDCDESVDYGSMITLGATPATGFVFDGWSGGGCTGTGTCTTTVTAATTVTATFSVATYTLTVNLAGNGAGGGSVSSTPSGISCSSLASADCDETYNYNQVVTLTPSAATGRQFAGWSGACTGNAGCQVTMTQALSVTATFTLTTHTLTVTKTGAGPGSIQSSPSGINCPTDCDHVYNYNTVVDLAANAPPGSQFAGWSGACSGTGACQVTMTGARNVGAQFNVIPPNYVFVTSTSHSGAISYSSGGVVTTGIAAADAICNAAATASATIPDGTYVAYLSTSTTPAPSRLTGASGWVRYDGKPVFERISDISSGHMFYPIKFDENGNTVAESVAAMTGSSPFGADSGANCNNYTSSASLQTTTAGLPSANSFVFAWNGTQSCATTSFRFYCFGVDRQAVVKPPPGTYRRAFVTQNNWKPTTGGTIANADSFCAGEATAAGLTGTYKALLAGNGTTAISRFTTSGANALPWARVDNTLMTDTAAELAASLSYLLASPNQNAAGTQSFGHSFIYTGAADLVTPGTMATTCNNWSSQANTATGRMGIVGRSEIANFFNNSSTACDYPSMQLICMQE